MRYNPDERTQASTRPQLATSDVFGERGVEP